MSKLLIGLVAATLGVGGISLSSGNDDSTSSSSDVAAPAYAAAAQPVAAVAAMVSPVVDPFERSAALCADKERYNCVALGRSGTVQEMLPQWQSWERVRTLNGWAEGEVSPDTVVPAFTWIAFSEKS